MEKLNHHKVGVVKVANVIHVATKGPTIDVNPLHLNIYHIYPMMFHMYVF